MGCASSLWRGTCRLNDLAIASGVNPVQSKAALAWKVHVRLDHPIWRAEYARPSLAAVAMTVLAAERDGPFKYEDEPNH